MGYADCDRRPACRAGVSSDISENLAGLEESGVLAAEWQDAKRLAGYEGVPFADVPGWVSDVWIGYSVFETVHVFEAINAAGPEFRDRLDAAYRLGGSDAVEALVDDLLAQGGTHVDR